MKHLGDITKIKGCDAPVVDCIIGGSPCQDLSVAGKRAGLAGERSGLYMEQIRIIKEMRHKDEQRGRTGESIRPRYMVWENVPGAFSSNQGKDFAAVIEEAIKVADPEAPNVPVPEKGWPTSGCFMGDHWSVAWRVLDAQFWGVPQRRRRIALVADFGGQSAPEILFIRKGVSRDLDESESARKATAGDAQNRTGADDRDGIAYTLKIRGGCSGGGKGALIQTDRSATLSTLQDQTLFQPVSIENHPADSRVDIDATGKCLNLTSRMGTGGGVVQPILDDQGGSQISVRYDGKCPTLRAETHENLPCVMEPAYCICNGQVNQLGLSEKVGTLNCMHDQQAVLIPAVSHGVDCRNATEYEEQTGAGQDAYSDMLIAGPVCEEPIVIDRAFFNQGKNAQYDPQVYTDGTVPTLVAKGPAAVQVRYIVRRLTPLECERLQGFPDGWTDIGEWVDSKGKKHKEADSPRYKALGNSIAIPPWKWVLKRLCACYERDATMASLFDGIGGFPYIWEQLNGKGSCLWASEIEEFPMAVTKLRFGGNTNV
jgi:DNA (cytosine-5)-methyltransferase 1